MKRIIRIMMVVLFTVAASNTAWAQEQTKQRMTREQLADVQARRIVSELALDEQTGKKFIETYTNCQKEIWALGPRQPRRQGQNGQQRTEEQSEQAIKDRFVQSQKILNIRHKYYEEYSKFLTQTQIERVYQIEKQMMNRFAKHRDKGQKRPNRRQ